MLINSSKLLHCSVQSLHLGEMVAQTTQLIIDPDKLQVVAFKVFGYRTGIEVGELLETSAVREYSEDLGLIIDSEDEFVDPGDVIKLDEVMSLQFKLIGLKVVTRKGVKLGKVTGFVTNSDDFMIMQVIVQRPVLKGFLDPELIISRSEIVEVDDYKVVVKSATKKAHEKALEQDFVPNFVNPFRQPQLAEQKRVTKSEPEKLTGREGEK